MSMRSVFIVLLMFGCCMSANAQIRLRVAAGLSTDWITNNNPATFRMVSEGQATDTNQPFGGSLDGMQSGWGLKCFVDLDKQKNFRIPFGVDYWMFTGTQTVNGGISGVQVRHEVNIISTMVGFEWSFVEFPMAFARAYVGAELRPTFIGANSLTTFLWNYSRADERTETTYLSSNKEACTRLGGMVRLGVEGELYYPVFINTSVAWGVMNMIGRDTRPTWEGGRGELLTASKLNEGVESYVQHLNFTFMIQVRL